MKKTLLLGYDIGSSSIKATLLDAATGEGVATAVSPAQEMKILAPRIGWAEQQPDVWWQHVVASTRTMVAQLGSQPFEVAGIGISYQMHGLVMVGKNMQVLSPSIIWCDSRAVPVGQKAVVDLGKRYCLGHCLNAPGNFTASKLKWVRENRPNIFAKVAKIMLPGDYIAMKLTGTAATTISGLSEGIFWDFRKKGIADELLKYYGIKADLLPDRVPTFGFQGSVTASAATELGLKAGIPVTYRAGDQPNNALSLNVLKAGEIAATAGTSGVIYGVTRKDVRDPAGRVNTFAHVNYTENEPLKGVLLCINGTGIQYSWIKQTILDNRYTYGELNDLASGVEIGSGGVLCYPYGNGAERSLENRDVHGHFSGINFNLHHKGHLARAAQEGIAFSFRYGMDVMKDLGMEFKVIRAGFSNLFQSKVFQEAFVSSCNVILEIYNTDGSQGAARGAGIGVGCFSPNNDAFKGLKVVQKLQPTRELVKAYESVYKSWKSGLARIVSS
jgi:xylulokinase